MNNTISNTFYILSASANRHKEKIYFALKVTEVPSLNLNGSMNIQVQQQSKEHFMKSSSPCFFSNRLLDCFLVNL